MRAKQLLLWLSSVAYVLANTLREVGLQGTQFAKGGQPQLPLRPVAEGIIYVFGTGDKWSGRKHYQPLAAFLSSFVD
ncbi:hypothetical protein [Bythopirellula polymerisocia]|uniref:Transposase DDE domain-containing protein n=1 Tax=Bythopirellula polymerisocia TaxID=2528003 RepID=A0A5C6CTK6_9BACT|nr:hypothetical protein [Bythopirellula polymerisocia]TWU26069.1 hypothetical protein Pla144_32860 [Bythopirellula polymerisocia]